MKEQAVTDEQLVAYASGDLDGRAASTVEAYLAVHADAARTVTGLRRVIDTLRRDDTAEPAADAVRRALAVFGPLDKATAGASWLGGAARIIADLVFESRNQMAPAGFRGGGSTAQLAYECVRGRIDLQILPQPAAHPWRLIGQVSVTDRGLVESVALLDQAGTIVASTSPDSHGRFRLESRPGIYDLLVELDGGDQEIIAPGLEVG